MRGMEGLAGINRCRAMAPWPCIGLLVGLALTASSQSSMASLELELMRTPQGAAPSPSALSNTSAILGPLVEADELAGQAAGQVPVYKSAPKQINGLEELGGWRESAARPLQAAPVPRGSTTRRADELIAAGGRHHGHNQVRGPEAVKKARKRTRVYVVESKERKKKRRKVKEMEVVFERPAKEEKKKKKKKKKKSQHRHGHDYNHLSHHHHHRLELHEAPAGKYYEYRSVPEEGSWKFGFRRGNRKHSIKRQEHGHKSHFRSTFKWQDRSGQGVHLFDFNHHQQGHERHKGRAAGSEPAPKRQVAPAEERSAGR